MTTISANVTDDSVSEILTVIKFKMADSDVGCEDALTSILEISEKSAENKFKCCQKRNTVLVCIRCYNVYHPSCANRIAHLKVIEGHKVVCCRKDVEELSKDKLTPMNSSESTVHLQGLYEKLISEIEDKNLILKENNNLLKDKIKFLENLLSGINSQKQQGGDKPVAWKPSVNKSHNSAAYQNDNYNQSKQNDNYNQGKQTNVQGSKIKSIVGDAEIINQGLEQSKALADGQNTNKAMQVAVNNALLATKSTESTDGDFTVVQRRRKRANNVKIGTAISETGPNREKNTVLLKSAVIYKSLHVYKLQASTSEEEVIQYLKNRGFMGVKCEKLNSRRPDEYSSFKVSVTDTDYDKLNCEETWPTGVRFNHFLHRLGRLPVQTNMEAPARTAV